MTAHGANSKNALAAAALTALLAAGCTVEKFAPHLVAMGVGRLTVRNSARVMLSLSQDTRCGFLSDAVVNHPVVQGKVGEMGQVQWRIDSCRLDFGPQLNTISTDCNGIRTQASGAATVSGTKTVVGVLTGDAANPVIPSTPDAATFDLKVQFDNMTVKVDEQREFMTWESGTVAFTAKPYLASSASLGLCSIPTRNVLFEKISYGPSKVYLEDKDHQFHADVDASNYGALVGKWGAQENAMTYGTVSVWGTSITVPWSGDHQGLDIYYDSAKWLNSYTCSSDLNLPVSYSCASPEAVESQGAARLSVSTFGNFATYVDDDKICGFASERIAATPVVTGTLGNNDGTAVYTMPPCTLHFPDKTVISTDCQGVQETVQGDVTISGTKTVHGIYTGNVTTPIVPTTWEPSEMALRLEMSNFTFSDRPGRSITFNAGAVSGLISDRTAQDLTTGACSIKTPVAGFQHVNVQAADVVLKSGDIGLRVLIDGSDLTAQNGQGTQLTNYLAGTVTLKGKAMTLPQSGDRAGLDPDFNPDKFTGTYNCKANERIAETTAQCDMRQTLGENAARLLVQNAANAASMAAQDSSCGFDFNYPYSSQLIPDSTLRNPTQSTGSSSGPGSLTYHVDSCEVAQGKIQRLPADCSGNQVWVDGSAVVTGDATVSGQRYTKLLFFDAVFPTAHDGVAMNLPNISFYEFATSNIAAGQNAPAGKLVIHSGSVALQLNPMAGQRISLPDHFDVVTPVTAIPSVVASNLRTTLVANGLTFNLDIPSARLQAFNGSFAGKSNFLSGQMQLGPGAISFENLPLDPNFKQATFDATYACTNDLMSTLTP